VPHYPRGTVAAPLDGILTPEELTVPVPAPTAETRWRCALCGNLTRFDVERTVRSREFMPRPHSTVPIETDPDACGP
jgi:hypothetical protein